MPKVTFKNDSKTVEAPSGTPLKEVCDDHFATVPFGCTEGFCGTCAFTPIEGAENFAPKSDLEKNTTEEVLGEPKKRLACQAVVTGDVTVEY